MCCVQVLRTSQGGPCLHCITQHPKCLQGGDDLHTKQYSTEQYIAVQSSTEQYRAVQSSAEQYRAVQSSTEQYSHHGAEEEVTRGLTTCVGGGGRGGARMVQAGHHEEGDVGGANVSVMRVMWVAPMLV